MKRKYRCEYSSDCDSDDEKPRKRFAPMRAQAAVQFNTLYDEINTLKRMIQELQKLLMPLPAPKPKTAVCSYIA